MLPQQVTTPDEEVLVNRAELARLRAIVEKAAALTPILRMGLTCLRGRRIHGVVVDSKAHFDLEEAIKEYRKGLIDRAVEAHRAAKEEP